MVQSRAKTVQEYLASLPEQRRETLEAVRKVILKNLPKGFQEMMDFGMISYVVPLSTYPKTYNGHPLMLAALAAQKNYYVVYLMTVYGNPEIAQWFEKEYKKSGKKLDMGKSCVRFKTLQDLPLDVIGKVIARVPVLEYIAQVGVAKKKRSA